MTTYAYEPLSTERSVRMLSLYEATNDGNPTLSCCLVEVPLDDRAIIRMGVSSPTSQIFVNGCQLAVIVWLGTATEHTMPAFRLLFGLAEIYEWSVDPAKEFISYVVRDQSFKYHWIALGELLQREWWDRAWILQEITLARRALVVCGPYAVDWDRIIKATWPFNISEVEMFSGMLSFGRHMVCPIAPSKTHVLLASCAVSNWPGFCAATNTICVNPVARVPCGDIFEMS
ncbi:hypothetical protein EDB81DRAFT_765804 [Dactylonectria macrodidyma]|uniref:Heterokaryon incompatibility domain-containing protein n=1 Tax=Dactylonectria macrodidyma TaxID=307937 RepID=A0A9P9IME9_9HYPO|nr:hypothetical protein EDB81DRAFT_765804 [Dactylonectria macrodidyma]